MKKILPLLILGVVLCACTSEPEAASSVDVSSLSASSVTATSSVTASSEEVSVACEHVYGDAPTETVGNLDIYECIHCGEQKVVANGTLIGGE